MWRKLFKKWEVKTEVVVSDLLAKWEELEQNPSQDLADYVEEVEKLASKLSKAGEPKTQVGMVNRLLKGLNSSWNHHKENFCSSKTLGNFDEVVEQLVAINSRRAAMGLRTRVVSSIPELHFTEQKKVSFARSPDRSLGTSLGTYRDMSPGRGPQVRFPALEQETKTTERKAPRVDSNGNPPCSYCNRFGHLRVDCPRVVTNKDGVQERICFRCFQVGHKVQECTNAVVPTNYGLSK
jgi:hypothetical protein